jgi:hypothetical protein
MIRAPERPRPVPVEGLSPEELAGERETPSLPPDQARSWPAILMMGISVFLSVSAAAWMSAGVFRGWFARLVAVLGALVGVGIITFSFRSKRPSTIQYLVLPAALVLGAVLVVPAAGGGTGNIVNLILEAVRAGGIAQPPIPFDPGWRFILVFLTAALGAAAMSTSATLNKPKLGVFMPLPLMFAAALIQPPETSVVSSVVALFLLVGALAVSYGADLRKEGASSGLFEVRRYARGGAAAAVLVVVLVLISRAGFLFPDRERNQVIPPKKPEPQALQADRLLFTVSSDRPGPWRLGVLDVYQDNAWLFPPFDLARLQDVPGPGKVPDHPAAPSQPAETIKTTFTIADVEGHQIPAVASPVGIEERGFQVQFDPRTQTFRLPEGRASSGMTYTIESPTPPSGEDLVNAPTPPEEMRPFLEAPIAPNEVVTLLSEAPGTNLWDRLQFVRNAFYQKVVAAGAGTPTDVPPARVAEMLQGMEASPYEITGAEALLARWAGVPSRIGYGFYRGDRREEGESSIWQIHPRHGSTWLEVYFEGHGWIPVVGIPPRARASLSEEQKNTDPSVRPSEELALVVYVPVKLRTVRLLYVAVRYWALVSLPLIAGLALLISLYPWPIKVVRRLRRRRWASRSGPRERIAVAYANFRDTTRDLNIGDPSATPLIFTQGVEEDPEHDELAWLVTRTLWGDLRRDLRTEDVESAEDMCLSVTRRVRRAQPATTRLIALGSRSSLREPFTSEVPNFWPSWAVKGAIRGRVGATLRKVFRPLGSRIRKVIPIGSVFMALTLLLSACGSETPTVASGGTALPEVIAPAEFSGFVFQQEEGAAESFRRVKSSDSLVTDGKVFTIRKDGQVLASLQAAQFKPGLGATRREVRQGVLESIGTGRFELTRVGGERMYVKQLAEQNMYLWFPATGRYYELLVARKGFEDAGRLFASLIRLQRGEQALEVSGAPVELPDPRRGEDG